MIKVDLPSEAVKIIGDKKLKLVEQIYSYYQNPKLVMSWAYLEPNRNFVEVKYCYPLTQCRETMGSAITLREAGMTRGVDLITQRNPLKTENKRLSMKTYIPVDKTAYVLLFGFNRHRLEKGLRVIHHYEQLARNGRSALFPVEHNFYSVIGQSYPTNTTTIKEFTDLNITLVAVPSFWHSTVIMSSMYLLLLRVLQSKPIRTNETVKEYLGRIITQKGFHQQDKDLFRRLYEYEFKGKKIDLIDIHCRHWKALKTKTKPYLNGYGGYFGSNQLAKLITLWQGDPKNITASTRILPVNSHQYAKSFISFLNKKHNAG